MGRKITTKAVSSAFKKDKDLYKKLSFKSGNYICNISGYCEKYFKRLVIKTAKGDTLAFGDDREDNFNFKIPDGMAISGIEPGIGGHLHNLTVYYGPILNVFKFSESVHSESSYNLCRYQTAMIGHIHGDTKEFDDWDLIDKSRPRARITQLCIYYDEEYGVHGFRTTWDVAGVKVLGGKYCGSSYNDYNPKKSTIQLSADEYITEVYGRTTGWIQQICFKTSEGHRYEFGNATRGDDFNAEIPSGHAVGALTGGTNGHLHNLTVWYGKINRTGQGLPMVQYYTLKNRFPKEFTCGKTYGDTKKF